VSVQLTERFESLTAERAAAAFLVAARDIAALPADEREEAKRTVEGSLSQTFSAESVRVPTTSTPAPANDREALNARMNEWFAGNPEGSLDECFAALGAYASVPGFASGPGGLPPSASSKVAHDRPGEPRPGVTSRAEDAQRRREEQAAFDPERRKRQAAALNAYFSDHPGADMGAAIAYCESVA
jgi:hypothetical protein